MTDEQSLATDEAELTRSLEEALSVGGSTLVVVESDDGLAGSVVELIPDGFQPVIRGSGALGTRAKVGYVADSMDLADLEGGLLVIENAQWGGPDVAGTGSKAPRQRRS